ncbi:MAG: hypothetical protein Kow0090_14680 [Myxococcota bacterium]
MTRAAILKAVIIFFGVAVISSYSFGTEFYNPRPLGLGGAYRALADGNDALYLNPAGMSLRPNYHVDMAYSFNRWGGGNIFNISIKDSETSYPLAAGLGFTYLTENENLRDFKGYRLEFGLSYLITTWMLIGGNIRYYDFDVGRVEGKWANATADIGLLFPIHQYISFAVTGTNLIRAGDDPPPLKTAQGIRVGHYSYFNLLFDFEQDYTTGDTIKLIYHGAGELMLGSYFAFRIGYSDDFAYEQKYITGGLGFISPRFGLDFGIKQRVGGGEPPPSSDRWFGFGLKMFM